MRSHIFAHAESLLDAGRIGDHPALRLGVVAVVLSWSMSAVAASASGGAVKSGSRITVRQITPEPSYPGGQKEGLHDELLGVDCSLLRAADGVTRCLPVPNQDVFVAKFSADASCTIPVAGNLWSVPGTEYPYGVAPIDGSAPRPDTALRVFRTVGEIPADRPVFRMISGKCARIRRLDHERYFLVGDEVEPARFVAFATKFGRVPSAGHRAGGPAKGLLTETSGSRTSIVRAQFAGEDGTFTTPMDILRDEKLGTECSLESHGGSAEAHCLPENRTYVYGLSSNVFADASCKKLLAHDPYRHPPYAIASMKDRVPHVFPVIQQHPANAPIFTVAGDKCVQTKRSPERYFVLGSEIPLTDFVGFRSRTVQTRSAPDGAGLVPADGSRITGVTKQFVGADGTVTRAISTGYHDEKLAVECLPRTASDGITRCLPANAPYGSPPGWFADAQCTTMLAEGKTEPSYFISIRGTSSQVFRYHVLPIGAEYSGPVFFLHAGKCVAPPRRPPFGFSTVGAEIPATGFVAFTESQPRSASLRAPGKAR